MSNVPQIKTLTTAPLRHRLRIELRAPVAEVWALVGDHARLPEYSEGIERVSVENAPRARTCYFRPRDGVALKVRERIRWEQPNTGYSTSAEPGNEFALENDLSFVTVAPSANGTLFTWEQYYDHPDLPAMRAGFGEGIADIGHRLVGRFGGRILELYADGPIAASA